MLSCKKPIKVYLIPVPEFNPNPLLFKLYSGIRWMIYNQTF